MSFVRDVLAYPVTLSFHRGARLRRNEEQARKHRQAGSLIRTRQLHVVSYIGQDMWDVLAVSYPLWVASLWSRTLCLEPDLGSIFSMVSNFITVV